MTPCCTAAATKPWSLSRSASVVHPRLSTIGPSTIRRATEVDGDHDRDEAADAEQATLAQHLAVDATDAAVDVDLGRGCGFVARDAHRVEHEAVTVEADEHVVSRHAELARQLGVRGEMRVLTVHRDEPFR